MVCIFDHNFRNFFLLPIHLFPYVSCFVLLSVFPTSFHLRTKFPVNWDRMLCICISVNAVVHCMLVKHADTYTHAYLWTHGCFTFDWKERFCFNHVRHTRSSLGPVVPAEASARKNVDVVRDWDLGVTSPLKVLQNA
jgi:hypothetical protein